MKKLWLNDILETQRCILRIPKKSEAEEIWGLVTPNIQKYLIRENINSIRDSKKQAQEWKLWDSVIYDKNNNKILGRISISYVSEEIKSIEIWYWLSEQSWGQWIMFECVKRLVDYSFKDADYEKVIATCNSDNEKSIKLLKKMGFIHEWTLRKHQYVRWIAVDIIYFWMLKEDYLRKQ